MNLDAVNAYRAQNGLGPVPASQIQTDRYSSIDVRFGKSIRLGGQTKLELVAQLFNILGTDNLNAPFSGGQVTNALSSSFGQILRPRTVSRRNWPSASPGKSGGVTDRVRARDTRAPATPPACHSRQRRSVVMADTTRRWSAIGVVATAMLVTRGAGVHTQQPPEAHDLATIFAAGDLLQDRNGDGVIDFVNARIVLGEMPTPRTFRLHRTSPRVSASRRWRWTSRY